MEVIIIYQTDPWHGRSSMELIGIATTEKNRDKIDRKFLRELHDKPSCETKEEAFRQLNDNGQTQCLAEECDLEIYTETVNANELLN